MTDKASEDTPRFDLPAETRERVDLLRFLHRERARALMENMIATLFDAGADESQAAHLAMGVMIEATVAYGVTLAKFVENREPDKAVWLEGCGMHFDLALEAVQRVEADSVGGAA